MNRRQFLCTVAATTVAAYALPVRASQTRMTVYKDPNCRCCGAWAKAMSDEGFEIDVRDTDDLSAVKAQYGVPDAMQGCHTAILGSYFTEGHVPLEAVTRLLKETPDIAGLAVPGMPAGSLGMGDDPNATYVAYSVPQSGAEPGLFMTVGSKQD